LKPTFGKLRRGLCLAVCAALLCGCQSATTTYTAKEQGSDNQKCQMFGYKPGTDDHRRCMFYTYGQRERQTVANNAANNQAAAAVLVGAAAVGLAAAAIATAPRYQTYPRYWCGRWRCYYY